MITTMKTKFADCYEVDCKKFGDDRGYFMSFTKGDLKDVKFKRFSQFSESKSAKGVLRGMHFQKDLYAQAKLVSVVKGKVLDVIVDCRKDSPTFGEYQAFELDAKKRNMLFVPRGFAHGFLSLKNNTVFQYFVDNDYNPSKEDGIAYDDPIVNIDWEKIKKKYKIKKLILSEKDSHRYGIDKMPVDFSLKPKKYFITGYSGQLGHDIATILEEHGENRILTTTSKDMDVSDRDKVMEIVQDYNPDVIFHCAAYTKVDDAEKKENISRVWQVNCDGTKNIVEAAKVVGAKVLYTSTDYVYDGEKEEPYVEGDRENPKSVYGASKFNGEIEVSKLPESYIARVSWVFGINNDNFCKKMLRQAANGKKEVYVVDDQIGSPTYSRDLAAKLIDMSFSDKYGLYHITNEGFVSFADYARYIFEMTKKDVKVIPISTEESIEMFHVLAARPRNSRLDKTKLSENFGELPNWQNAVERFYTKELKKSIKYENRRLI